MKLFLFIFLTLQFFSGAKVNPLRAAPLLTEADKKIWIVCIKKIKMKPPCCGACKIMSDADARAIWNYLIAPSSAPSSGETIWQQHKKPLLAEFKNLNPQRYQILYANEP